MDRVRVRVIVMFLQNGNFVKIVVVIEKMACNFVNFRPTDISLTLHISETFVYPSVKSHFKLKSHFELRSDVTYIKATLPLLPLHWLHSSNLRTCSTGEHQTEST